MPGEGGSLSFGRRGSLCLGRGGQFALANRGQFGVVYPGTTKHQHNAAVSVNVKCATQGEYPNINLDYSKVVVSMGTLAPAVAPTAALKGSLLTLTWAADADMDWGIKNDRALLLVYCPELDKAVYVLSGARRSTGHNEIELPVNFIGKELHCYVAFKSSDGKKVSDSAWVQAVITI